MSDQMEYLSKIEDIIDDALNRLSHDDFICLLNDIEEMVVEGYER